MSAMCVNKQMLVLCRLKVERVAGDEMAVRLQNNSVSFGASAG